MRRAFVVTGVMLVVGWPAPASADAKKPVVAVFGIEARSIKLKPEVLASLTTYLASKISESGEYEVVPPDKLKDALTGKKKESYRQCFKQSCQIEIGQELAADKALSTQVMKVGTRCMIACNLYDLKKATSGRASTAKGECSEDGISTSIDEAVAKLTRREPAAAPPAPPAPPAAEEPAAAQPATAQPAGRPAPATAAGKGWLGMKMKTAPDGVLVLAVYKGTPAHKAGLQRGDVIVRVNQEPASSIAQVVKRIGSQRPGGKIVVRLKRQGKLVQLTAVPEDASQAAGVYAQACNDGDTGACTLAGMMFASGEGVLADPRRAAAAWRKGCEAGEMDSCSGLGVLHVRGSGVAKDLGKGAQLYRKACDGGSLNGCCNLGQLYAKGIGVARDPAKAVELCRKACDGGDGSGCKSLGFFYEQGTGVAVDRAKAAVLYRKACDGGNREGCDRLRQLGK